MGVFNRTERAGGSEFTHYREDWAFRTTYAYGGRYFFEYNGAYNEWTKVETINTMASGIKGLTSIFFNLGQYVGTIYVDNIEIVEWNTTRQKDVGCSALGEGYDPLATYVALKWQWQWNHNPVNEAWSLTERKGWLRLKTCRLADNLFTAPNTISQRMEGPECSAKVCIDISKMRDGDRAGFAAFNGQSGVLVIARDGKQATLAMQTQEVNLSDARQHDNRHAVTSVTIDEKERIALKGKRVWLHRY